MGEYAGWLALAGVVLVGGYAVYLLWRFAGGLTEGVLEALADADARLRKVERTVEAEPWLSMRALAEIDRRLRAIEQQPVVTGVHPITGEPSVRTIGEGLAGLARRESGLPREAATPDVLAATAPGCGFCRLPAGVPCYPWCHAGVERGG